MYCIRVKNILTLVTIGYIVGFIVEGVLKESRVVALMYTCIRTFKFNVCIV